MIIEELKNIGCLVLSFVLGAIIGGLLVWHSDKPKTKPPAVISKPMLQEVKQKTKLEVTEKKTEKDPDVVVVTKYVAEVNGQRIEAPIKTTKDKTTATVNTTIDVTPMLNKMKPNWEIGAGVGTQKDFAISVQRNYKNNRSIEAIYILDNKGKFTRGYLLHKWSF